MDQGRAFDDLTGIPCPICLKLAQQGAIQLEGVMPLPKFPGRTKTTGEQCCRDCQATEATMALGFQHPDFAAARLTISNERVEGLRMPFGMMEGFGLCKFRFIRPASNDDLKRHQAWINSLKIELDPEFCPWINARA